jgi:WD40 repeat protein
MQASLRSLVLRVADGTARGLRGIPSPALLSLLCASALSPLFATIDGISQASVAFAGSGVLSSIGGGVLSGILTETLARARSADDAGDNDDLDDKVAAQIGRVLSAAGPVAMTLRSEIASMLTAIDAGGTVLRAALEEQSGRVRAEVIAAIGLLGADFAEMGFLVRDVAQAAAAIQHTLDAQGADVRAVIEQNVRQSADIRLVREDVAAIARRVQGGAVVAVSSGAGVDGCPYRGLLPFEESDAEVFYGRERLVAELAVKVAAQAAGGGMVVVTGASGAGKSSLLKAGLLPALARGRQVSGSARWPRITFTPTADPLTELAARLAALGGGNAVEIRNSLLRDPGQAHLLARQVLLAWQAGAGAADQGRLVLIIDQFEQLFTLGTGFGEEPERRAFVAALHAAASTCVGPGHQPPAVVVLAVRGDFCDRCAAHPELAEALRHGQFVVGPMTESELRLAITGPADAAGLTIDAALTGTILADLRAAGRDTAGVLPLLSQAMALTWDKRDGDRLTSHGYGQVGGVGHAVQISADSVYDTLTPDQRSLAKDLLCAMTVASRDGRLTRRPVSRADLYAGRPRVNPAVVDAVLEAFAGQRLIVLDDQTAQLAHDVLLDAWPRLQGWLDDDRASWILHGQLRGDAEGWRDSDRDPSFLYRGTQLSTVRQAASLWTANPARYPALTSTERDFLDASKRAAARTVRWKAGAVAMLAVLTVAALVASGLAYQQDKNAISQKNTAVYDNTVAQGLQVGTTDPELEAQFILAAYRMKSSQDLRSRLLSTENLALSGPLSGALARSPVVSLSFSNDGRTLASAQDNGAVQLWNTTGSPHPRTLLTPRPADATGTVAPPVRFDPDSGLLAAGAGDGAVGFWDGAGRELPGRLPSMGRGLVSLAFSRGGLLATGSADGTVRLWSVTGTADTRLLSPAETGGDGRAVSSVAFSPDGGVLASGGYDGTIRVWNVSKPADPTQVGSPQFAALAHGSVSSVAFSPDGGILASGDFDGTIRLWSVSGTGPAQLIDQVEPGEVGSAGVYSLAFSPDGAILASANTDGTVRLWDVADPAHTQLLDQPQSGSTTDSAVTSLAFSPVGRTLAAGSADGTIRLWNIPRTLLVPDSAFVTSVAFSPDGRTLASGGANGLIQLWDVTDPAAPEPLGPPLNVSGGTGISSVAFSPDSSDLASVGADGLVRLWGVANRTHPRLLGQADGVSAAQSVAFSPDGDTLAVGKDDGSAQLWDVSVPSRPLAIGSVISGTADSAVYAVAFSPVGHMLATGESDGTIGLWNVADPANPQPLDDSVAADAAGGSVISVVFSPDGQTLATGDGTGVIGLWSVVHPASPRRLIQLPDGNGGAVYSVAFGPGGRSLASGGADGMMQVWDVAAPARARAVDSMTVSTTGETIFSIAFDPRSGVLATGSGDGTIRLWNLDVAGAVQRICATTASDLTPAAWFAYLPLLPYRPPCG